ncbi:MAG: hypothetical protein ACR2KW_10905 [Rubrobacter sp.]
MLDSTLDEATEEALWATVIPPKLPDLVSNVANPFVIFTALYAVVALVYSGTPAAVLVYIVPELLAAALVAGYVLWMRRRRKVEDFWLSTRTERFVPAVVLLGSFIGLLACLLISGAPPEVFRLTLSMGFAAALVAALTLFWKASAHSAVAGHAAVAGIILLGGFGLPFALALPMVLWSRVVLKAHTLAQALAGAALGGAFAAIFLV